MVQYAYYECPFGFLKIGHDQARILSVKKTNRIGSDHCPSPVSDLAAAQLEKYFAGKRTSFDLPLSPVGTDFQKAVWKVLAQIPYGEIRSYGEIAAAVGNPRASRAVGQACNKNPIWIVIPCHRVVGKNTSLTGYAGGIDMKQALLDLEQHNT